MGQREAISNALILFGPIAIGVVLGFLMFNAWAAPIEFPIATLVVYGLGLLLFLVAKVSLVPSS